MTTWIALLRGINVGGRNKLPMAELRSSLQAVKFSNVRTYIQSGNVVFDSSARTPKPLQRKIANTIYEDFDIETAVFVLAHADLAAAMDANPFPNATQDPKSLHFFFLSQSAEPAEEKKLQEAKAATENFVLTDNVFYLHAPDGIARSKLAANAEKLLGVDVTARNYRTVEKLNAMAGGS